MTVTERYLFGDTDLAARRLRLLAEAFEPSSSTFISESTMRTPRRAADLGCGPGYSTRMLAEATGCKHVMGLDSSSQFVLAAARSAGSNTTFAMHDVTEVPFPSGSYDLIYARFLLTHQRQWAELVGTWGTQLVPGGRLLLEEVESVCTDTPVFSTYLTIAEAMLADGGHDLYIGPKLDEMVTPPGMVKQASTVAPVPLTTSGAGKLFLMNLRTWRHNTFVKTNCPALLIDELQHRLTDLADARTQDQTIEWRMRQIVFEREK